MEQSFWQSVLEKDGALPDGHDLGVLTDELIGYVSSPDPVLRDEFGYGVLARWIFAGRYDATQMRALILRLEAGLRVGLGEVGTEGVFGRSFSALVLGAIIEYDREQPFLEAAELRASLERALEYLRLERDVRGFVPDQGWAHATAHAADWLGSLSSSAKLTASDLERILAGIGARITAPCETAYQHHEPTRLASAALEVIKRDALDPSSLHAWLDGVVDTINASSGPEQSHTARSNTEAFLSSLYFQIMPLDASIRARIQTHITSALERLGFVPS